MKVLYGGKLSSIMYTLQTYGAVITILHRDGYMIWPLSVNGFRSLNKFSEWIRRGTWPPCLLPLSPIYRENFTGYPEQYVAAQFNYSEWRLKINYEGGEKRGSQP